MKKHLSLALCSIVVVCGLAGCCCKKASDPYFDATVKHVDAGGEMFSYVNLTTSMKSCENIMAQLEKAAHRASTKNAVKAFARTLDLKSVKAIAQSSVKVSPGLYVYKSFVLIDKDSKSILSGKATGNVRLDSIMGSLPADTRLAIYANIDNAYLWTRINEEIAASGDKALIETVNNVKINLKNKGLDVNALAASVSGPMMLVVAGQSPLGMKAVIIIADRDGVLSAALRKKYPPKAGESAYPINDLPFLPKAQLVYAKGCVMFVSDPKLLEKPAKMLKDTKWFGKFAPQLPAEGSGFMIVNISKKFAKTVNAFIPKDYTIFRLKPVSMVTVETASEDGIGSITVSDFSVPAIFPKTMEAVVCELISKADGMKKEIKSTAAPAKKLAAPAKKPAK